MYIYKTTPCMVAWYFSVSEVLSNKAAPAATYPQRPWPTHEDIIDIWSGLAWHEFFFFWPFLPTSLHLVFFFQTQGYNRLSRIIRLNEEGFYTSSFFLFFKFIFIFRNYRQGGAQLQRERERGRVLLIR